MSGLLLLVLAVCLMGGGWLLWKSIDFPPEPEPPYDWSADWPLLLQLEAEHFDALVSVSPAPAPKTWSELSEEDTWLR